VAAPSATFGLLFDPSCVPPGWVQVGGVLFATFGLQYLVTALWPSFGLHDTSQQVWSRASSFYVASVWSRLFLALMFGALVALGRAEATLLVLAGVNVLGLLGMQRALTRKVAKPAAAPAAATASSSGGGAEPLDDGFLVAGGGVLLDDGDGGRHRPADGRVEFYMGKVQ
jgi:hypothetical protein